MEGVQRRRERDRDPPDIIERILSRVGAEPDGLTDDERRARDWADYHEEKRRQLEEQLIRPTL